MKEAKKVHFKIYPSDQASDRSNYSEKDINELSKAMKTGAIKEIHLMYEHSKNFAKSIGKIKKIYFDKISKWMCGIGSINDKKKLKSVIDGKLDGVSLCYSINKRTGEKDVIEVSLTEDPDFEDAKIICAHNKNSDKQILWPLKKQPITNYNFFKKIIFQHSKNNLANNMNNQNSNVSDQSSTMNSNNNDNSNVNNDSSIPLSHDGTIGLSDVNGSGSSAMPNSNNNNSLSNDSESKMLDIPGVYKNKEGGYFVLDMQTSQNAKSIASQLGVNPNSIKLIDYSSVTLDHFDIDSMDKETLAKLTAAIVTGRKEELNVIVKENAKFRREEQRRAKEKFEQEKQSIIPIADEALNVFGKKVPANKKKEFTDHLATKFMDKQNGVFLGLTKSMLEKQKQADEQLKLKNKENIELKKQLAAFRKEYNQQKAIKDAGLQINNNQKKNFGEFTNPQTGQFEIMSHSKSHQEFDSTESLFNQIFASESLSYDKLPSNTSTNSYLPQYDNKHNHDYSYLNSSTSSSSSSSSSSYNNNNNNQRKRKLDNNNNNNSNSEYFQHSKRNKPIGFGQRLRNISNKVLSNKRMENPEVVIMSHSKAIQKSGELVHKNDGSHIGNRSARERTLEQTFHAVVDQLKSTGCADIIQNSMFGFEGTPTSYPEFLLSTHTKDTLIPNNKTAKIYGFEQLQKNPRLKTQFNSVFSNEKVVAKYGVPLKNFGEPTL